MDGLGTLANEVGMPQVGAPGNSYRPPAVLRVDIIMLKFHDG